VSRLQYWGGYAVGQSVHTHRDNLAEGRLRVRVKGDDLRVGVGVGLGEIWPEVRVRAP